MPEKCACNAKFDVEHALSCKKGGFVTIRHNEIRDVTARMLKEVTNDVRVEPPLQKLTGEKFESNSANQSDDARLDISARGFWISGQKAFFDVRVFNPLAKRYRNTNLQKCYEQNEKEKKKKYNERVLNVEQGSFTPIVMSSNGGLGREATKFYARLAEMLADKRKTQYSIVSAWVKRKLSFSLIRSVTLCLRGSRSLHHDVICNSILSDIALSEMQSKIEI